jgi:hypothetical protein
MYFTSELIINKNSIQRQFFNYKLLDYDKIMLLIKHIMVMLRIIITTVTTTMIILMKSIMLNEIDTLSVMNVIGF